MVLRVAVIGTGAAGLCALRHLTARPAQFEAVGFEQLSQSGGTWIYTDKVGTDENGLPVQSSMYKNLRTNLPKEVMAFPDYPFPAGPTSFISHEEVLKYLQSYAAHYNLGKYIKYETKVDEVDPVVNETPMKWKVSYSSVKSPEVKDSTVVDAVMVCNGHYAVPLVPDLPGMSDFQGTVIHSHNYRAPAAFRGQTVVCLGAGASGQDICMELSSVAKQVILSHNRPMLPTVLPDNFQQQTGIDRLTKDSVVFKNGEEQKIDTLMLCTGYRFKFPFLSSKCNLTLEDERLTPLYKHVVHVDFPTLSIIGVCKTICPFPQFDCQVRFVLSILEGRQILPSVEEMKKDIAKDLKERLDSGMPVRHAHTMGTRQWAYNDELAALGGFEPIPRVVQTLYDEVHRIRVKDLPHYKQKKYTLVNEDTYKEL